MSSILVVDFHVSPEAGSMCIYIEAAGTDVFEIHGLLVQTVVNVKLLWRRHQRSSVCLLAVFWELFGGCKDVEFCLYESRSDVSFTVRGF